MRLGNKILTVIFGILLLNMGREYLFVKAAELPSGINSSLPVDFEIPKKDWDCYKDVFSSETIKSVQISFSFPLVLKGTIISSPDKSYAIIEDVDKKKQDLYKLGDMVYEAKIVSMNRNSVTLDYNGAKQELSMFEADMGEAPPRPCPEVGHVRGDASDMGLDFAKILTQLRLKPYFEGGKCAGFQINNINSGFKQMGLQDGDIVKSINGVRVDDPLKAMQMIYSIERNNPVHLGVERKDEKVDLDCRLKDENI